MIQYNFYHSSSDVVNSNNWTNNLNYPSELYLYFILIICTTVAIAKKSIKLKWINMLKYYPNKRSKASYNGWLLFCNSINLKNKYLK